MCLYPSSFCISSVRNMNYMQSAKYTQLLCAKFNKLIGTTDTLCEGFVLSCFIKTKKVLGGSLKYIKALKPIQCHFYDIVMLINYRPIKETYYT
jgi:hypothetical protein